MAAYNIISGIERSLSPTQIDQGCYPDIILKNVNLLILRLYLEWLELNINVQRNNYTKRDYTK